MSRFSRVLALMVLAVALVVQMAVPSVAEDQARFDFAAITLDAPAAQAESDRANVLHAQYVAGQDPSDPNNITCSVYTPVAFGTPLIAAGPIVATHEDVATGVHDCIDRQRGTFRHQIQISFEYRKNGVWLPTDLGTQQCSHNAVQGVSIFHVDCAASAEYPLVPNHPSLGYPHRARYDVLEPKVMPPVYSGMFLTVDVADDLEAIYEANRGHHCQIVWDRDRQPTSAGPVRDAFCLDPPTCADFLFLDNVLPCERRNRSFDAEFLPMNAPQRSLLMNPTRRTAAAVISFLALTLLTGTTAVANEALPMLAGRTVITVNGNGGARLHNPKPVLVDIHSIDIEAGEGTGHFLVRMVSRDCPEAENNSRWCNGYTAAQWPHFDDDSLRQFPAFESSTHNTPDDLMPQGPVDVYVVSDGPLTITADFEGLTGSTEVAADGAITATMEVMEPAGCNEALFGDCSRFGSGGATHSLTDGFAFSVGWAQTEPMQQTTGQGDGSLTHSVNGDSCIYTAANGEDTSPDSYEHGCDLSPLTVDGRNHLRRVVLQGVGRSTEIGWVNERGGVEGDAYVGFRGYSMNPESLDEGAVGGLGVWLERGIGQ